MKMFLLLFTFSFFTSPSVSLLVIDMDGKKPLRACTEFSAEQYLSRTFPIYETDLKAVVEATVQAAKCIGRAPDCGTVDTIRTAHSLLIVRTECDHGKRFTMRYVTKIDEQNFLCDFELVKKEGDPRAAQTKLIDFAAYLSQ
jgi:hypothetical protein